VWPRRALQEQVNRFWPARYQVLLLLHHAGSSLFLFSRLVFILVISHYPGAVFVDPKIRNKGELFLEEKLPEKQLRRVTT
jgi:hypothetical protein